MTKNEKEISWEEIKKFSGKSKEEFKELKNDILEGNPHLFENEYELKAEAIARILDEQYEYLVDPLDLDLYESNFSIISETKWHIWETTAYQLVSGELNEKNILSFIEQKLIEDKEYNEFILQGIIRIPEDLNQNIKFLEAQKNIIIERPAEEVANRLWLDKEVIYQEYSSILQRLLDLEGKTTIYSGENIEDLFNNNPELSWDEVEKKVRDDSLDFNKSFNDDKEKMKDFKELSKSEFLSSYSYLTEEEYDETKKIYDLSKYCERIKFTSGFKFPENLSKDEHKEYMDNLFDNITRNLALKGFIIDDSISYMEYQPGTNSNPDKFNIILFEDIEQENPRGKFEYVTGSNIKKAEHISEKIQKLIHDNFHSDYIEVEKEVKNFDSLTAVKQYTNDKRLVKNLPDYAKQFLKKFSVKNKNEELNNDLSLLTFAKLENHFKNNFNTLKNVPSFFNADYCYKLSLISLNESPYYSTSQLGKLLKDETPAGTALKEEFMKEFINSYFKEHADELINELKESLIKENADIKQSLNYAVFTIPCNYSSFPFEKVFPELNKKKFEKNWMLKEASFEVVLNDRNEIEAINAVVETDKTVEKGNALRKDFLNLNKIISNEMEDFAKKELDSFMEQKHNSLSVTELFFVKPRPYMAFTKDKPEVFMDYFNGNKTDSKEPAINLETAENILNLFENEEYGLYVTEKGNCYVYDKSEDFSGEGKSLGNKDILLLAMDLVNKSEEYGYECPVKKDEIITLISNYKQEKTDYQESVSLTEFEKKVLKNNSIAKSIRELIYEKADEEEQVKENELSLKTVENEFRNDLLEEMKIKENAFISARNVMLSWNKIKPEKLKQLENIFEKKNIKTEEDVSDYLENLILKTPDRKNKFISKDDDFGRG